jgi:DNA-binding LacI/PurR family transcriptional regulator
MKKIEMQKAKHVQLKEILINEINNDGCPAGTRLPSELELIRQYAVSNTTVHKALAALEHEGYIYREKGRGTFVADYKKSNGLKDKRILGFVTIFSGMLGASLFNDMLNGIVDGMQSHGCEMIFRSSGDVTEREVQHINELSDMVDGLVIFLSEKANVTEDVKLALARLQERRIPFVLVDRYINGLNCNYVVTDNFAGAYGAVEHLKRLGHKSIVLLSHDDWRNVTSSIDRVRGYEQAVADFNIDVDLNRHEIFLSRESCINFSYERVVENIMEVCGGHAAVAATEYHLAVGIVETAQRMGFKVPEDLAVTGFDEYGIPGYPPSTGITTVIQPMYDIGRRAIDILADNIKDGVKDAENVFMKPRLVVRDSCGSGLVESV